VAKTEKTAYHVRGPRTGLDPRASGLEADHALAQCERIERGGSPLKFANGSTAMDGLSDNADRAGSSLSDLESCDAAGFTWDA